MLPTILIGLLVAVVFFAIVGKGIGGCSACGGSCGGCHGCGVTVTKTPGGNTAP